MAALCTLYILTTSTVLHVLSTVKPPEVKTNYGYLRGVNMISRNGRVFSAFLGIPYATPPISELRFRPPISPQSWEGVRDASQEGNICSQGKYGGSEDCLYINVFTPFIHSEPRLSVMFYIHGGSFYMGSPSLDTTGPEYLMDNDIVLVTVRYRLGPFGFLSTEDSIIPGNMGMKDQVKALHWVKENIRRFGGNPHQVTLFGCSAGGASVHLHMQSIQSRNLFARGISQSGTGHSAFALTGRGSARASTIRLSQYLNCSTDDQKMIECLRGKTTSEIEYAHACLQGEKYAITKSIFRPVLEGNSEDAFITLNSLSKTTDKPWLTGITANEGILNIRLNYFNDTLRKIKSNFSEFFPKALLFDDICSRPKIIADSIFSFYFNNSMIVAEMIKSIEQMFTDWWFLVPMESAVREHRGVLYMYFYNHRGQYSYTDIYNSPNTSGVSHLDDLIALFKHRRHFMDLNKHDTAISHLMVKMWTNFAIHGDPTPTPITSNPLNPNDVKNFKWVTYTTKNPVHLNISTSKLFIQKDIYLTRLNFWSVLNVIDKYP